MDIADHKARTFIVNLLTAFLQDVGKQFHQSMRDQKSDKQTIVTRFANEGIGFVTKTLPGLGRHFDSSLQSGKFTPYPAFKKQSGGPLPCFLKGLTNKIFGTDGTLLDDADPDAIRLMRQVTFLFYKMEGDYPKELVDGKISQFIETDLSLNTDPSIPIRDYHELTTAQNLMEKIFEGFDPKDICPRPGPGATACDTPVWLRYQPNVLYNEVHQVFPYYNYFYYNNFHLASRVTHYRKLHREDKGVSTLLGVPKDSRGPRLICEMPHEYMWFQQGLGRAMMHWLESMWITKGHVNFFDQTVNQMLALSASQTEEWVTLDMKEASDRVSKRLVDIEFERLPDLCKALFALTVDEVQLPDGTRHKTNMYAPMGSALCFPVMSVTHFVLAVSALMAAGWELKDARKSVYVYGDDLIVKSGCVEPIVDLFERVGLRFNMDKSCIRGKFRESCGMDAYAGHDVTPVRIKKLRITSKRDPGPLSSLPKIHQALFLRGLWSCAQVVREYVEDSYGSLPYVSDSSDAVGWIIPRKQLGAANRSRWKFDRKTFESYIKARVVKTKRYASMIGYEGILKNSVYRSNNGTNQGPLDYLQITESLQDVSIRDHTYIAWKRIPTPHL